MPENRIRKENESTKVNLTFSIIFHVVVVLIFGFWAAREGALGTRIQEISVALVPPAKEPEPPKPEPPKIVEPPKQEIPRPEETAKPEPPPQTVSHPTPPPTGGSEAPSVAPAPAVLPDFNFNDGAKAVETGTNSVISAYKGLIEYSLRSNWERPSGVRDDFYVAEVEISVDSKGRITGNEWKKGSGDQRWDDSVRKVLASVKSIDNPPPKGFPPRILIRFDVQPSTTDL